LSDGPIKFAHCEKKIKNKMGRTNPWKLGLLGGTIPPIPPCGGKVCRHHSMQSSGLKKYLELSF